MGDLNLINTVCSVVSIFIASGALYFAFNQVRQVNNQLVNMNKTFTNSTLMTVLELENELIKRKISWDDTCFKLREYSINLNKEEPNKDVLELLIDKKKISFENYLNALDRFCYCILHNYISEKDWRTEYRDVIFDIVRNNPEEFNAGNRFRNTIKIHDKWKDI
ncbi:hypothetical protein [Tenacibaculum salmonis]|uniref:hypothetical protein n=1 Tax=Tenacibaculum sp. P3-BQ1 TaxID=3232310 RepID=UPI0034DE8C99